MLAFHFYPLPSERLIKGVRLYYLPELPASAIQMRQATQAENKEIEPQVHVYYCEVVVTQDDGLNS